MFHRERQVPTLGDPELIPQSDTAGPPRGAPDMTARRPDGLISREQFEALSEKSDLVGLSYLIAHFALIGLGGWLTWLAFPGVAFVPILLTHAFVIGFLFSPLHECAHTTAFRRRWLNETALWIVAVVYIVPPYFFRYFHLGHHRYTQVPGMDPSLVLPEPASLRQYLWYCAGLWFWWRNLAWIVKHAAGIVDPASADYVPPRRLPLMVREARIMAFLYSAIAIAATVGGFATELLVCWILPRFLGEPVQRLVRVAEHVGCAETPDLLDNTRTTLSNRLINAIAWQMPYHAEHHLFPSVPFHRLPELHRLIGDRVVVESRGYIAGQREIIANLRDPARQATVPVVPRRRLL